MDGDWIIVVAVGVGAAVLGYLLLSLAVGVFVHALATAVDLFSWAAEGGFIGVVLYIIVWGPNPRLSHNLPGWLLQKLGLT